MGNGKDRIRKWRGDCVNQAKFRAGKNVAEVEVFAILVIRFSTGAKCVGDGVERELEIGKARLAFHNCRRWKGDGLMVTRVCIEINVRARE